MKVLSRLKKSVKSVGCGLAYVCFGAGILLVVLFGGIDVQEHTLEKKHARE